MSLPAKRQITLERTFEATVDEIWELWTTKEGLESWWGPEGFSVKVHKLDLRPGGERLYAMSARSGAEGVHEARGDATDDRGEDHLLGDPSEAADRVRESGGLHSGGRCL